MRTGFAGPGNLKFDQPMPATAVDAALRPALGVYEGESLILAGITHAGEEEALVAAYRKIVATHPNAVLMLAPRHVERAADVVTMIQTAGMTVQRRSRLDRAVTGPRVIVLDTRGELARAYTEAAVAFVGGTLVPVGGHNLLEPAVWGKPVLFGPYTDHCAEIAALLLEAGGGVRVFSADDLTRQIWPFSPIRTTIETGGMAMRRLTLVLALCTLVLSACSPAPVAPATPTRVPLLPTAESTTKPVQPSTVAQSTPTEPPPTPEPLATLEPASSPNPDGLVDDFSNPVGSGWDICSGTEGSVGYENGEYLIQVDEADYSLWANPGRTFRDVLIGVKAQLADGSPPADMGVICRYQDAGNFIYGEITSDGFYGITQVKNGDPSVLTCGGKLQRHAAIQKDTRANQIQFMCAGNRFALTVNDQFVAEIEVEAPASGDVGLIAGTFEKTGARVRFDDFSAVVPPPVLSKKGILPK